MHTIFHLYKNNDMFKAGFLIGCGFTFMVAGSIFVTIGGYSMIKNGFNNILN